LDVGKRAHCDGERAEAVMIRVIAAPWLETVLNYVIKQFVVSKVAEGGGLVAEGRKESA
jgi:hypothetical protein